MKRVNGFKWMVLFSLVFAMLLAAVSPGAASQSDAVVVISASQTSFAADQAVVRGLAAQVGATPKQVRDVIDLVSQRFRDTVVVAGREAERRSELAAVAPATVSVPTLPADVHDLAALLAMATHLAAPASR